MEDLGLALVGLALFATAVAAFVTSLWLLSRGPDCDLGWVEFDDETLAAATVVAAYPW